MTEHLTSQVRDGYTAIVEDQAPVTLDEIMHRAGPIGPVPTEQPLSKARSWKRPVLVASAAAAAVILLIGVPLLVSRTPDGPTAPANQESPSPVEGTSEDGATTDVSVTSENEGEEAPVTTVPPVVAEVPADRQGPPFAPVDLDSLYWTKVDLDPVAGEGYTWARVERDIDGYVISGNGRLLFSRDARTWSTDPISPELADYSAFRSEGQWALGGTGDFNLKGDLLRSDGSQWRQVDLPASGDAWPQMPVVSGTSVLASTSDDSGFWVSNDDGPFEFVEAPWVWPEDMLDPWTNAPIVAAPDGGFVALVTVNDVHPNERNDPGDTQTLTMAELWTSPDGLAWQNHGLPTIVPNNALGRRPVVINVQSDPNHILVSRSLDGTDAGNQYLTSTNGLDWENEGATYPTGTGVPGAYTECRTSTGNFGYFCGHWGYSGDSGFIPWLSTDNESWQKLDPPEIDFEAYDVDGPTSGAVGDVIFVGYGDIWIGQFR
jgi:hypothetical protein